MRSVEEAIQRLNQSSPTIEQIEKFSEDIVWTYMRDMLISRIEVLRTKLEQARDIESVISLQEQIAECRFLLDLPEQVKNAIEMNITNEEE